MPDAPKTRRAGNGVIQRAVIEALAEADRPMDVGEAHTAVEGLLGYPVSRDSVTGHGCPKESIVGWMRCLGIDLCLTR